MLFLCTSVEKGREMLREDVDSPSLGTSKARLDKLQSNLLRWEVVQVGSR